ncbi:MAG: hypothetical protein HY216_16855 [Candidatus Rokubacteria bacterium]|nr:hypothetical protein [Candidatus Rokubacteria bacterium]
MGPGDDWTHYDEMATAVARGDLSGGPAGPKASGTLLYGYVLGALRAILGPGTYPLYFMQHVMLGCALVILAYVAQGLWGPLAGVTTLAVANVWAVADVTRWYSMRLLSENLFLPVVALAWLAVLGVLRRPTARRAAMAGAALGITGLTRFNSLAFVVVAVVLLARYLNGPPRRALVVTAAVVLLPAVVFIVIAAYLTYTTTDPSWHWWWRNAQFLFGGHLAAIHPEFRFRPHWPIMWALTIVWFARAPKADIVTQLLATQIGLTAVPLLLLPHAFIGTYGFRYTIPLFFPMILCLGALAPLIAKYFVKPGRTVLT